MCLSIPGQVIEVRGAQALVRIRGRTVWCNAMTQPAVRPDDYVLTHANLIIAIVAPEEAQEIQEAVAAVQGWTAIPVTGQGSDQAVLTCTQAYQQSNTDQQMSFRNR